MISRIEVPDDSPPATLLTYTEAGKALRVSARTVWGLVDRGELPAVHVGPRSVRIDPRDLTAFIARAKSGRSVTQEMTTT